MIHRWNNFAYVQCDWCGGLIRKYPIKYEWGVMTTEGGGCIRNECIYCQKNAKK